MISLKFLKNLVAILVASWAAFAASAASAGTPTLTFDGGWVGEYSSAINNPANMFAFDGGTPDLNIASVTITQNSSSNSFELQGNDIPVTITVNFVGGSTQTVTGGVNWRVIDGQTIEAIGLRVDQGITDGYPLSPGSQKTYLLRAPSSSLTIANGGSINGNAALSGVLDSLNALLGAAAPVITGPSGGAGAAASAISVDENQTAVTQLSADENVTWSITGGNDAGQFQIAPDGTITFVAAPDFENPTDGDTNNTYVLTVTATDVNGNTSTQTVTVTVLNLQDSAPVITGPNGGPGAAASSISVDENQTAVTQLSADKNVTWSITGGNDAGEFQIAPDGTITFVAAPDFEGPTDSDTNNAYVLTVTATDANGNTSTQTVTVTVLNLDDTAPVITGPTGGAGAAASAVSVNESQTIATQLSANEAVTWTITGGADAARFEIAANGTITFRTAPDFENPTDGDTNNTYVLIATATDAAGNASTQTVTVTVLNLDDTAPVITGPSGGAGAAASAVSVNENQTAATQLSANEAVTWAITGGADAARFEIAANGTITFRTAPDFENPTDGDTNNTYVLIVTATDAAGNASTQTVTVTVLNLDDTAPVITGPSGGAGAAASAITINEGLTAVTTFTANEAVTWSIDGGADAGKFRIDPATGAVTFVAAPDFENPTDADRNNTYIVRIKAVDAAGNVSFQTLTVTIVNVDEIARKLAQIGGKLKTGLRTYATQSLSDMLSFNEGLMRGANDDDCVDPSRNRDVSGNLTANETQASLDLNVAQRLSKCGGKFRVLADAGFTHSRMAGNWNTRLFGSLRAEAKLDADTVIGAGVMVSRSDDTLLGFEQSKISDNSVQGTLYARYRFSETLRTGVFAGYGRASYDFNLTESDGFALDGEMTGKRHMYGWTLSGDFTIADTVVTTDAVISRAVEKLGNATLSAQYLGENRSGIAFNVGTVDVTRISVPVSAPITLSGGEGLGQWSRLLLSTGLLCEDNNIGSSALVCGHQLGGKLVVSSAAKSKFYADYRYESVDSLRRSLVGLGYALRFGRQDKLELALEANRGVSERIGTDSRAMLTLRVAK
ncbi:MAG: Ig-like domain-containing protein [Porphyrobacter sp.]|nr:Ig-like domain-containing protein [Porphyrobacter sp.]